MKAQERVNPSLKELHQRLAAEHESLPHLIGLTGGIASGKTLVASFFRKKKIPVIDADLVARDVVKPGKKAYCQILEVFGPTILKKDKTLNRQRLGEVIFGNEGKRKILEAITHPEIRKEILAQIAKLKQQKKRTIVIDAALLFESGLDRMMEKNILVTINPSVQLKRLVVRDRISETEAWTRILSQIPAAEKQKLADYIIDNSGTRSATTRQVARILRAFAPDRGHDRLVRDRPGDGL